MSDFQNRPNPSRRAPIFSRTADEESEVQVGELLDFLAALMRKQNRGKAGDQSTDPEESQEQPSEDSQN